jgi:hypothetical protein
MITLGFRMTRWVSRLIFVRMYLGDQAEKPKINEAQLPALPGNKLKLFDSRATLGG